MKVNLNQCITFSQTFDTTLQSKKRQADVPKPSHNTHDVPSSTPKHFGLQDSYELASGLEAMSNKKPPILTELGSSINNQKPFPPKYLNYPKVAKKILAFDA